MLIVKTAISKKIFGINDVYFKTCTPIDSTVEYCLENESL